MSEPSLFTWRHLEVDIILCAVRWYLGQREGTCDRTQQANPAFLTY